MTRMSYRDADLPILALAVQFSRERTQPAKVHVMFACMVDLGIVMGYIHHHTNRCDWCIVDVRQSRVGKWNSCWSR